MRKMMFIYIHEWIMFIWMSHVFMNEPCLHEWTMFTRMNHVYMNEMSQVCMNEPCLHEWIICIWMNHVYMNESCLYEWAMFPLMNHICMNEPCLHEWTKLWSMFPWMSCYDPCFHEWKRFTRLNYATWINDVYMWTMFAWIKDVCKTEDVWRLILYTTERWLND